MNQPAAASVKYTPRLVLTAVLSGGLTIGISLVYFLLCLAGIVLRYNCDFLSTSNNAVTLWDTIYRVYIQNRSCFGGTTVIDVMDDLTVVILVGFTLGVSVLCVASAITLISLIQDDSKSRFISWAVYAHIGCCVASYIVDLTAAIFFGIDFGKLSEAIASSPAEASTAYLNALEIIRQGAFWMMTIALKGYFVNIVACVLLILLVIYLVEFQNAVKNDEHSIHKVGVLNAFDSGRKPEETWSQSDILYNNTQFLRTPQINNGFEDDSSLRSPRRAEPTRSDYFSTKPQINNGFEDDSSLRSPRRAEPPRSDYFSTNRSFDRSDSWHHTQNSDPQGSRLFSYLDDIKRPASSKPPASPAVDSDSQWRRDPWQSQTPPVPAPDYSPTQPRRLKSALKSPYM